MKVVHIHRPARTGGHSIETLFRTVAAELRLQGITVIDYELGSPRTMLADLFQLRSLRADIYHVTGDVNYWAMLLPKNSTVLTIHDVGHYLYGLKGWRKAIYGWLWITIPIYVSRHVTVVSVATKQKLQEIFEIHPDRISIIENCYNHSFFNAPRLQSTNRLPRILQIGTGANKNVPRLIQALQGIPCTLILIGKINAEIETCLGSAEIAFENYIDISQSAMIEQYAAADIVSFVSTHEGFGMPIIEAQAMGKPVITSNMLPMSEIAGPGACLVDPLDITSIHTRLNALLYDDIYRARIIDAGLNNVVRYSPCTIASKYLDVYNGLLEMAIK